MRRLNWWKLPRYDPLFITYSKYTPTLHQQSPTRQSPDSHPIVVQQFQYRCVGTTARQLPVSEPTVTRQVPDSRPTVARQSPVNQPTITRQLLFSHPTVARHSPVSQPAVTRQSHVNQPKVTGNKIAR